MPLNALPDDAASGGEAIPLQQKVAFLRCADSYDEPAETVEAIETHMSWVFLTDRHAYKLKKPVQYTFLNFGTLEARRQDCEEELRLNRRLSPEVYLATVPLTLTPASALQLGGAGRVVEWLVKMRRLPADAMLDQAIARRTLSEDDVRRVALHLCRFLQAAERAPVPPADYLALARGRLDGDLVELGDVSLGLPQGDVQAVCDGLHRFLDAHGEMLMERARAGRIVDGHGDLRPQHICIGPVAVIDCLEFNRDFRVVDAVDDLAFLAMECERLQAPLVGEILFATYREVTGDDPPREVILFYKAARACLRAKLAIWHTRDPAVPNHWAWVDLAVGYLRMALSYAAALPG